MAKSKKKVTKAEERPILYPEVSMLQAYREAALTDTQCKDMLGWTIVGEKDDFHFLDEEGNRIFCTNNVHNRPLYMTTSVERLIQEHLRKRWKENGETIIIGKTGSVLNGQHSLISCVLAEQRRLNNLNMWEDNWPGPVTMAKLVVYGIDESDDVVNTMDTCKPRSLSDVIYRSEYFKGVKGTERKVAATMTDFAIRMLWSRVRGGPDAYSLQRTHAESLDFLGRHERVMRAVRHIISEDTFVKVVDIVDDEGKKSVAKTVIKRRITKYVSGGAAAGLLYLMAASDTDGDVYANAQPAPSEKRIKWTYWDKAAEFWSNLAASDNMEFDKVRHTLGMLASSETGLGGTNIEKTSILIKAWNLFKEDESIQDWRLSLDEHYKENQDGLRKFVDPPEIGGIDNGPQGYKSEDQDAETTEEQRQETAEEIREEKGEMPEGEEEVVYEDGTPVEEAAVEETQEQSEPVEEVKPRRYKLSKKYGGTEV